MSLLPRPCVGTRALWAALWEPQQVPGGHQRGQILPGSIVVWLLIPWRCALHGKRAAGGPGGSCSTPFSPLPLLLEGFSRKPSPGNHVVIRCAPKRAFCSMVAWLSACGARVHAEMLLRGFGGSSASCHRCSLSPVANCNAGERCRAWGLLHPERPAGECCWVRKGQTRPLPARPCREVGRSRAGCCRPVTRLSLPAGWRSLASTTPTSGRLLPPCPAR